MRGHSFRLKGGRFKTEMRRNYFTQWVMNLWNSLPQRGVDAGTLKKSKEEIGSV